MDVREELLTIAEIGVGIAGFSGIVAAFVTRSVNAELDPVDRRRFVSLFAIAFVLIALAFVPIVMVHLGLTDERVWSRSSLVMVGAWFLNMAISSGAIREIRKRQFMDLRAPLSLSMAPSLVNLFVQVLNAGGWIWQPGFIAYLFGLFVYMYAAGLMFVYLVLFRPKD